MAPKKFNIYIYAHWKPMPEPKNIGILSAHYGKGRKAFSFEYNKEWLKSKQQMLLDPDIQFYSGPQYPNNKENFGVFLDSMPDTWGRTLMKRRTAQQAKENNEKAATPTPPWSSIAELQEAAKQFEDDEGDEVARNWLKILMAPGSSLGGARPKANILDKEKNLWIAKFPSKNDTIDKAAWEFLAYQLALNAGINMAPSKIQKITGNHHTFFTKRFDRDKGERIHFASAMTMTGNNKDTIREDPASYLEIAEFIQNYGCNIEENLHKLWRRIVFNIAISNTDDHLRNHGFILTEKGWIVSPAYDINPSIDKDGLALNIDMDNNALDIDLAKSVGEYFRLNRYQMDTIIKEVSNAVIDWKTIATKIGISKKEQLLMEKAFLTTPSSLT